MYKHPFDRLRTSWAIKRQTRRRDGSMHFLWADIRNIREIGRFRLVLERNSSIRSNMLSKSMLNSIVYPMTTRIFSAVENQRHYSASKAMRPKNGGKKRRVLNSPKNGTNRQASIYYKPDVEFSCLSTGMNIALIGWEPAEYSTSNTMRRKIRCKRRVLNSPKN